MNLISTKIFLDLLLFCGVVLTVLEIGLYRDTMIPLQVPMLFWLGAGSILTPFLNSFLRSAYRLKNLFLQFVFNTVTWGGFVVFLFMWSNYAFAKDEEQILKLPIKEVGSFAKTRSGCGNPYVLVEYTGREKQLVLPCDTQLANYSYVCLTVKEGAFGYQIVVQLQLAKQ